MDIITAILFVILFSVSGYFIYEMFKLKKIVININNEQKKALAEAGNAITDTLKIIFDNLKRQSAKTDKLEKKETEYQSRFHKIENDIRRLTILMEKHLESKNTEEKKNERNNIKAN